MHFTSIVIEGGLLSPDFLEIIHEAAGQKPQDFGLKARDSLVDEVSAVWGDVLTYWNAFQRRKARSSESLTTITREQWLLPLLEALGYSLTYQRSAVEVDGRSYPISHRAGADENDPPVHLVAYDQELGDRPPSGRGTRSPHALVQDYLNRTDDHLWGIVSNGRILRLLRDSTYFTRPAYIEFDLEQMILGERLDEFFLLYRLAHRSRLPQADTSPTVCLLEQYHQAAIEQGGRIRDGLRQAVADAILTFGNGFLRHPRNAALRQRLYGGALTQEGYYQQLLYLIYRLLFLMVAEERNLLEAVGETATYYRRYFSVSRLRTLADAPLSAPERFDDLYLGLRTLFHAFHDEQMAAQLGVPALNGELFSSDNAPDLDAAHLNNRDLLWAIRLLSYFTPPDEKVRRRVNYAALDVEELGSVYESLLDEQPVIDGLPVDSGTGQMGEPSPAPRSSPLTFSFVSGTTRKTTGSYYTPRELVNEVIKSALLPVIEARLIAAPVSNTSASLSTSLQSPVSPSPQEIALLSLRICDPACGSGHFLLAAARRIGYELAKVRAAADEPAPDAVRAATREAITHCIYGVDKNPLAVDLCKVALWIEGHSRGKPLTFLDYRIRCGDSLVGVLDMAILDEGIPDEAFAPVTGDDKATASALKKQNKEERAGQMSLFDQLGGATYLPDAADWQALEQMPEDTPAQINAKRAQHQILRQRTERARTAANLWTSAFFSHLTRDNLPHIPTTDVLRRYQNNQPVSGQVVGAATGPGEANRFFHWPLEFPQVFDQGGFDVVLGNPPWERIKLQEQEFFAIRDPEIAMAANKAARQKLIKQLPTTRPRLARAFAQAKHDAEATSKFVRQNGRFSLTAVGDVNSYALFAELSWNLLRSNGLSGIICPTGISSDSSTQGFFRHLVDSDSLVSLLAFVNEKFIFPTVVHNFRFCILTVSGTDLGVKEVKFAYECQTFDDVNQIERYFSLTKDDLNLINPNTRTAPIFRTKIDAELVKKIHKLIPVLDNELSKENFWEASFTSVFHMSSDSGLFESVKDLESRGFHLQGNSYKSQDKLWLPLYEAKMIHQFDHRFAHANPPTGGQKIRGTSTYLEEDEHENPYCLAMPRYWIDAKEVTQRISGSWFIGFRSITGTVNNVRTAIFSLIPQAGVGNSISLLVVNGNAIVVACLVGCLNSLVFDYVVRQKISGINLNFHFVKQFPILPPDRYSNYFQLHIAPRILELVYTAWDIAPFAADIWQEADEPLRQALQAQWQANRQATGGHSWLVNRQSSMSHSDAFSPVNHQSPPPFPPFKWDDARRAHLRAELDAYYARLYGLSRDELRYILDPADIYGPDFPGETFRVLKEKEIKEHGEYRTQRLVLAAWDAQQAAIDRGELHFEPVTAPSAGEQGSGGAGERAAATTASRASATPIPLNPQLLLPDLALATKGSYSQRLKRAQALVTDTSDKATAELIIFLAAPESGIQWVAQKALEKRPSPTTIALLHAFLTTIPVNSQPHQLAQTILTNIER